MTRHVLGSSLAGVGLALLLPLRADAQAIRVYGHSPVAQTCFESAKNAVSFRGTTPQSRRPCTDALEAGGLSSKDKAATHSNRGVLSMALEKYESALRDFDAAMNLHPGYGAIHVNRGNVFFIRESYVEAIAQYTYAIEAEMDEYEVAYLNRGMAHELRGNLNAAEVDYRQALELRPEWGIALGKLARVLSKPR